MGVLSRFHVDSRIPTALCLSAALSASLLAQTVLLEAATPLLPQHFGAWETQDTPVTGSDAGQIDAAHADELREDGFRRFSTADYVHGTAVLKVQALQFVDATGASAALSLYRASHTGLRSLPSGQKLGTESAVGDAEALFRTGNTIVIAKGDRSQVNELQALAVTLPKISGPKGMSPLLPTLLPRVGLVPESLRYSLGPASYAATGGILPAPMLGFEKSAEEATAVYNTRSGREMLTLLLYPTPEVAGDRGRAVEGWVNAHHEGLGTIKLRREGPLVLMATGSLPAEEAQQMIENIHLRSQVTWDKPIPPEFHAEVRKTASLLFSIAVLSGVLMLGTLLLGLFLGVGRASIRVLMGKPAAVEPEFQGLGLARGPATPIHRDDLLEG